MFRKKIILTLGFAITWTINAHATNLSIKVGEKVTLKTRGQFVGLKTNKYIRVDIVKNLGEVEKKSDDHEVAAIQGLKPGTIKFKEINVPNNSTFAPLEVVDIEHNIRIISIAVGYNSTLPNSETIRRRELERQAIRSLVIKDSKTVDSLLKKTDYSVEILVSAFANFPKTEPFLEAKETLEFHSVEKILTTYPLGGNQFVVANLSAMLKHGLQKWKINFLVGTMISGMQSDKTYRRNIDLIKLLSEEKIIELNHYPNQKFLIHTIKFEDFESFSTLVDSGVIERTKEDLLSSELEPQLLKHLSLDAKSLSDKYNSSYHERYPLIKIFLHSQLTDLAISETKILEKDLKKYLRKLEYPSTTGLRKEQISEIYLKLRALITEKTQQANKDGKKLVVVIGEDHKSSESLFAEIMILSIIKKLKFSNYFTESSPKQISNFFEFNTGPGSYWTISRISSRYAKDKVGLNVIGVDEAHFAHRQNTSAEAIDLRNKVMSDIVQKKSKDGHSLLIVGANHLPMIADYPFDTEKFETLAIETTPFIKEGNLIEERIEVLVNEEKIIRMPEGFSQINEYALFPDIVDDIEEIEKELVE